MVKIISDRIHLINISVEHIDKLFEAAKESVDEVYPWLPWCHPEYKREETEAWVKLQIELWRRGLEYSFGIFLNDSKKLIGGVGLNQLDNEKKSANLGYWIRKGYTKKGYATEAALLVSKYGFENMGLERIEIVMETENKKSKRVAEKLKAKYEGIVKKKLPFFQDEKSVYLYSISRETLKWLKVNIKYI